MNGMKVYIDRFRKKLSKQIIRLVRKILPNYDLIKLSVLSLFYNDHLNRDYVIDTALEPMYWFVENFTSSLGPIFVFLVVVLIFLYVLVAYIVGLPFYQTKSVPITIIALFLGNYLLVNSIFHYFMAWKTNPGYLPSNVFIRNSISICKKCILPKPPRTHHCSVCDKCILKMDHHCPWLNNCIGHFNHRYFFMFCMFSWLGTIFVIVFGLPVILNHYFNIDVFSHNVHLSDLFDLNKYSNASTDLDISIVELHNYMQANYFDTINMNYQNVKNNCIIFEILLTVSAFVAIGGLMSWHAKIITNGETCIEALRNKKERLRLKSSGKKIFNPFDKGWKKNWKWFFGLGRENIGLRHILLPSTHKPFGDGIDWNMLYN